MTIKNEGEGEILEVEDFEDLARLISSATSKHSPH